VAYSGALLAPFGEADRPNAGGKDAQDTARHNGYHPNAHEYEGKVSIVVYRAIECRADLKDGIVVPGIEGILPEDGNAEDRESQEATRQRPPFQPEEAIAARW